MLGRYQNFPQTIHGVARFTYSASIRQLQQTIFYTLYQLNNETCSLHDITTPSPFKCEVSFEFGVAEESTFNFLDKEELQRLQKSVEEKSLPILDVYCAVRYHKVNESGKRTSLKFDYHMLRFAFYRRIIELFVSHERGTQRIPLEDLVTFLKNRINKELEQKQQKPLTLKHLRAL